MKNNSIILLAFILFLGFETTAQPWIQNDDIFNPSGIPSLPFSQPRFADLDSDGDMDMILGSIDDNPLYMENTGTLNIPFFVIGEDFFSAVNSLDAEMAVFKDIDNDGDLDMISGGFTGINLFENIGTINNPSFEKVEGFFGNLIVGQSPVPDLADLDNDGDLDMVVGLSESGVVKIYSNTGSLLEAIFSEPESYEIGDVGLYAYPHFCDLDADGDQDLVVGRDGHGFIYYENTGTAVNAVWEANASILSGLGSETYWNSPGLVDLDGDNTFDLIFGTASGPLQYQDNIGTINEPSWQENTSLFGGVLDVGGASNPVFYDYDGDGDLDMFTGTQMGDIKYFKNTGTPSGPSWIENSGPFSTLKHSIYSGVAIGDVNNDGNPDAIVGDLSGKLYYHRNSGIFFVFESTYLTSISLGGWTSPRLVDFDDDGDLDIIVGAENGTLSYIENQGDAENPDWILIPGFFSGLDVGSNCVPTLADVDFDGDLDMVCGNLFGDLTFFENVDGEWVEDASYVEGLVVDQNATPAFGDLDNDGDPDLTIGQYSGTFSYYRNQLMVIQVDDYSNYSEHLDLKCYPNPFSENLEIQYYLSSSSKVLLEIYNLNGQKIHEQIWNSLAKGSYSYHWKAEGNLSGLFFVKIKTETGSVVQKVLKF